MARLTDAKCKKCRRAGDKLFLKGDRCYGQKCAMVKRPYAPGIHGKARRRRASEFSTQLAAKQRVRLAYGLMEKQFKKYFSEALNKKGDTRQNLMKKLEMRLDNVIFRAGLAKSRSLARQLVSHKHVLVSGKPVNVASYEVKEGQVISFKERIKKSSMFENIATALKNYQAPSWINLDIEKMEIKIISQPSSEDLGNLAALNLIVEFYSR
ncbi:MAG: SSU ribosomal protein S4p (S9e) [Parcubacteria group bacterium GW2011_GWC2_42_6]|nr:MAG: SSU ribosomal protein S4p (S9e) [Parcubacteria group bacterium GW2011_GWC2_42_6]